MLQSIADRLRREDKGFTLIELMVVVLIIAILIAIAIPTFLGARQRAQDRAAQSSARNALTAAKVIFTDNETYNDATTTNTDTAPLGNAEPSLTFVLSTVASTTPTTVSVNSVSASDFVAVVLSNSGTCYAIRDVTQGVPGAGTFYASNAGACSADQGWATGAAGASW